MHSSPVVMRDTATNECSKSSSLKAGAGDSNLPKSMVRRPTAREKLMVKKVCVNVSGLFVEMCLLAMMRYAAHLSFETPQPCKGQSGKQASGAPF